MVVANLPQKSVSLKKLLLWRESFVIEAGGVQALSNFQTLSRVH